MQLPAGAPTTAPVAVAIDRRGLIHAACRQRMIWINLNTGTATI
jgi:hypothetical protein